MCPCPKRKRKLLPTRSYHSLAFYYYAWQPSGWVVNMILLLVLGNWGLEMANRLRPDHWEQMELGFESVTFGLYLKPYYLCCKIT